MAKDINLQDVFLNQARKDRIPVTIYITRDSTTIQSFLTPMESRTLFISMLFPR